MLRNVETMNFAAIEIGVNELGVKVRDVVNQSCEAMVVFSNES